MRKRAKVDSTVATSEDGGSESDQSPDEPRRLWRPNIFLRTPSDERNFIEQVRSGVGAAWERMEEGKTLSSPIFKQGDLQTFCNIILLKGIPMATTKSETVPNRVVIANLIERASSTTPPTRASSILFNIGSIVPQYFKSFIWAPQPQGPVASTDQRASVEWGQLIGTDVRTPALYDPSAPVHLIVGAGGKSFVYTHPDLSSMFHSIFSKITAGPSDSGDQGQGARAEPANA